VHQTNRGRYQPNRADIVSRNLATTLVYASDCAPHRDAQRGTTPKRTGPSIASPWNEARQELQISVGVACAGGGRGRGRGGAGMDRAYLSDDIRVLAARVLDLLFDVSHNDIVPGSGSWARFLISQKNTIWRPKFQTVDTGATGARPTDNRAPPCSRSEYDTAPQRRRENGKQLAMPIPVRKPWTDREHPSEAVRPTPPGYILLPQTPINRSRSSGAGLFFNQTIRRMSHAVMRGSSDAVISVLRPL